LLPTTFGGASPQAKQYDCKQIEVKQNFHYLRTNDLTKNLKSSHLVCFHPSRLINSSATSNAVANSPVFVCAEILSGVYKNDCGHSIRIRNNEKLRGLWPGGPLPF
jgi:hypothetical protein